MPAPLSARSAVLSLVLGTPGEAMTSTQLAAAAHHLDLNPATVRVALSRAVSAGELVRDGGHYRLGPRLADRRRRQDAHASVVAWDGSWETVVVVATGRSGADRAALRARLAADRLGELREGVWMRPANLSRGAHDVPPGTRAFVATPHDDPAGLAAELWDLDAWAATAQHTIQALDATTDPAPRLAVAAQLVRHLADDPLLPAELAPPRWPAAEAREAYAGYLAELQDVISR